MKTYKQSIIFISIICFLVFGLFSNKFLMNSSFPKGVIQNRFESKENFYFNPYILKIIYKHKKSGLLYYGSYHNLNIAHPQFNDIEKRWNLFKPDIAYSESIKWPLIKTKEDAIKKYGEQGLLRYLAHRDKVKIESIDPSREDEMRYLLKYYSVSKIKIYYILRQVVIDKEIFRKKNIKNKLIKSFLKNMSKMKSFNTYPGNIREFNMCIKKLLPEVKDWRKIDSSYFMNILRKDNILAKINITINKYRDKYMLNKIIKTLKKGKKIFAVVGKSHVISQENDILSKIRNFK